MDKLSRAKMYRDYLAEEGYSAKVDDDGDVFFKYEGKNYIIIIEDDAQFFRICFPNFWSIESEQEREKVNEACLFATSMTKVAKVFPVQDDTWAAVELFCEPPESFKGVFKRSLSALQAGLSNFTEKMHEE